MSMWLLVLCAFGSSGVSCITLPTSYESKATCVAAIEEPRRIGRGTPATVDFYAYCVAGGRAH